MPSVNQEIADDIVQHRLYLLRAETSTVRAMLEIYAATVGQVIEEAESIAIALEKGGGTVSDREFRRLVELDRALGAVTRKAEREMRARLGEDLGVIAGSEAGRIDSIIRGALPAEVRVLMGGVPEIDVAVVVSTPLGGQVWGDRLAVDLLAVHDTVRDSIAVSVARGASMDRAAAALRAAGVISETYKGRIVSIARTEMQRVANTAMHATYAANRDVLRGVIHISTLDTRTCIVCGGLHQKRYLYGPDGELLPNPITGPWRPNPQHPRCRCLDTPWVKSWRELGIPVTTSRDRERMDGLAPERMDYEQWLGRRSVAVQQDILGLTRYDAWKAGTPLTDMSDEGRPLTVAEVAAL